MKEKSCGAIVFNGDDVLIIEQFQGFFSFPKGHVEPGETDEETAIREVKEETNIDIEIISKKKYKINYKINGNTKKEVIFFIAKAISFDLKNQENEIISCEWVNKDAVLDKLTYNNIKKIFKCVLKGKNRK
jgi:8-oxo-dGTP pyrophosphatase MutT (NUDIX family)